MRRRDLLLGTAGLLGVSSGGWRRSEAGDGGPARSLLEREPEGWVDVMPGPRLVGWTEYPWFDVAGDDWRHVDQWHLDSRSGVLLCDGHKRGHTMFLHDRQWADVVYHVEWRFTAVPGGKGYNSGVLVRMVPETATRKVMYQVETGATADHAGWLRGGSLDGGVLTVLNTRVRSGGTWQRVDPGFPRGWRPYLRSTDPEADPAGLPSAYGTAIDAPVNPPGEWNTYEVACRGSTITVWTNGSESCVADNVKTLAGRVGLEAEGFRIEFRNLRVKKLA